MEFTDKILRGSAFLALASAFSKLSSLAVSVIVVRQLGVAKLGELALLTSWVGLAAMLSTLGLGVAAARFAVSPPDDRGGRHLREMLGALILLSLCLAILVGVAFGFVLWRATFLPIDVSRYALLGSCWVFMLTIDKIGSGLLAGLGEFSAFVRINAYVGILALPIWIFCLSSWQLDGAVRATVVQQSAQAGIIVVLCVGAIRARCQRLSLDRIGANTRALLTVALPTVAGEIVANPLHALALTAMATMQNGSVQLGYLNAATRFVNIANIIPGTLAPTLLPALTAEWLSKSVTLFRQGFERSVLLLWLAFLPVALFVCASSSLALSLMFGQSFVAAWPLVLVLMVQAMAGALNETNDKAFIAAGRAWLSAANNVLFLALFVPLVLWLIPEHGALGYCIGSLTAYVIYMSYQTSCSIRLFHVRLRRFVEPLVWTILLFALAAASAGWLTGIRVLVAASTLAAVAATVEWSRFATPGERAVIRLRLRRRYPGIRSGSERVEGA